MFEDLPPIGFGTYRLSEREECVETVTHAIEVGYRHIDTAEGYGNESYVGEAIHSSSVPRDELFIATKVSPRNLGYGDLQSAARASRERLGLDTLDLLYVHWPMGSYDPAETLPALEELWNEGVIRHIGVSNFRIDQLETARNALSAPIFAHQIECHPLLPQEELRKFAAADGHQVVAYSPIARGEVCGVSSIMDLSESYGATPAQVCLAWSISKGMIPIPKGRGTHVEENFDALRLVEALDRDAIAKLDSIEQRLRVVDFSNAPWHDG